MGETMENRVTHPNSQRPHLKYHLKLKTRKKKDAGVSGLGHHIIIWSYLVSELCLTLCDPMDCTLPGSSVHGISQARILEWAAISFSRTSSQPRHQIHISCTGRQILYHWANTWRWKKQMFHKIHICWALQRQWDTEWILSTRPFLRVSPTTPSPCSFR